MECNNAQCWKINTLMLCVSSEFWLRATMLCPGWCFKLPYFGYYDNPVSGQSSLPYYIYGLFNRLPSAAMEMDSFMTNFPTTCHSYQYPWRVPRGRGTGSRPQPGVEKNGTQFLLRTKLSTCFVCTKIVKNTKF